jgi:hypothetical protein
MYDRAGARNFEIRCAKNGFWSFSVSGLRACFGARDSDFGFLLIKKIAKPHDEPIPSLTKTEHWGAARSVLMLRKLGDLPGDFRDRFSVEGNQ